VTDALKPCPFCAGGKTDIHPNGRMWTGQRLSEPTSVSIRHWCEDVAGQPHRMIERVGRDEAAAIEAWNRRAALAAPPVAPGWVLVPVEPTPAMLACIVSREHPADWEAGKRLQGKQRGENRVPFKTEYECAVGQYQRLLAAAPGAPDVPQSHPQR